MFSTLKVAKRDTVSTSLSSVYLSIHRKMKVLYIMETL